MGFNPATLPPSSSHYNTPESSNYSYGGTRHHLKKNQYLNDEEKDDNYNRRVTFKLILDYYIKHNTFSASMEEDWQRHLTQFTSLCDQYVTDNKLFYVI